MKRYIGAMGVKNRARIIKPHNSFNPTISELQFRDYLDVISITHNNLFLDGIIQAVIDDINNDNRGVVSNTDIRVYYHKYYDMVLANSYAKANANQNLLNQLLSLV